MLEFVLPTAGLDLGNSLSKAVVEGGRAVVPTSCIKDFVLAAPRHHKVSKLALEDTLDAIIKSPALAGETRWLVGRGTALERTGGEALKALLDKPKVDQEPLLVSGLMALAVAVIKRYGFDRRTKEATVRVLALGTSLPVDQWKQTEGNVKPLRGKLRGEHVFAFQDGAEVGDLTLRLVVEDVQVLPEGMPAVYATAYQADGDEKYHAVAKEWLDHSVGVIDIGGGTIDLILFGKGLALRESFSETLGGGVLGAMKRILPEVKRRGWGNKVPNEAALAEVFRDEQGILDGQETLNLYELDETKSAFKQLGNKITELVEEYWKQDIKHFLMVGGGACLIRPETLDTPHKPATPTDPEWANAVGNRLFAIERLQQLKARAMRGAANGSQR